MKNHSTEMFVIKFIVYLSLMTRHLSGYLNKETRPMFEVPEKYRITSGSYASNKRQDQNNGMFVIPLKIKNTTRRFSVIASQDAGWEHVSVSLPERCPTWGEMCKIKSLFWGFDDCAVQYHPPQSDYINNHPYCLHLWRPMDEPLPRPPWQFVGVK